MEKNTNAVVTLLTQKDEQWGDLVDVVSGKNKSITGLILTALRNGDTGYRVSSPGIQN